MGKIKVLISGLPGSMPSKAAEHIARSERYELLPYALTGPGITQKTKTICGKKIKLVKPDDRIEMARKIEAKYPSFLVVDFASLKGHPEIPNGNAEFYVRQSWDFLMGATGGDNDKIIQLVQESDIAALIAPNMGPQIVSFQSVLKDHALKRKDSLKGCELQITESHQGPDPSIGFPGKADTSGTAKDVVKSFKLLGIDYTVEQIIKIREWEKQKAMGVPKEYRYGHGWHTYEVRAPKDSKKELSKLGRKLFSFVEKNPVFRDYSLDRQGDYILRISPDETVKFKCMIEDGYLLFTHNVNGRDIYGVGTVLGLDFLVAEIDKGVEGRAYSMIDVSKAVR